MYVDVYVDVDADVHVDADTGDDGVVKCDDVDVGVG